MGLSRNKMSGVPIKNHEKKTFVARRKQSELEEKMKGNTGHRE